MNKSSTRINWIDISKGLGIICIVLGHVLKGGLVRQFLYSFSVPFFFLLVGFTYTFKSEAKEYYITKFKRILLPYFIFALISIVIFNILGKYTKDVSDAYYTTDVLPNIIGALYGNSRTGYMKWNIPLWFLTCLFAVYFSTDTYERFVVRKYKKHRILCRIILIVSCVVLSYIITSFFKDIKLPFQFETAIFMTAFVQLGILLSESGFQVIHTKIKRNTFFFILALLLSALGCFISFVNGSTDAANQSYGVLLLYLSSSMMLSFSLILFSMLIDRIHLVDSILSYLGKNTIAILTLHKFPILFFQAVVPFTKDILLYKSDTPLGLLCAVIVTIIVLAINILFYKFTFPLFPIAYGSNQPSILLNRKTNNE